MCERHKRFGSRSKIFASHFVLFCLIEVVAILCQIGFADGKETFKRIQRSPQPQRHHAPVSRPQYQEQYESSEYENEYPSGSYGVPNPVPNRNSGNAGSGPQIARQLMLHNQEVSSGRVGDLPLYKQSYPGLYTQGALKDFAYEPTHPVTHGNSHHGKEGHLFLLHPDTSHIFRGVAHALHHENLI